MCFGSAPLVPRTKNVLVNNDVLKEQHPSPHRALSCFLIAPTERHGERCLSSSHPDRSLYAVLAFIRYAWCRMLCSTAVRVRAYVFFFFDFCSYLVLSASDRRPSLHVHTAANPFPPRACTFLCTERGSDSRSHARIPPARENRLCAGCLHEIRVCCVFNIYLCLV